MSVICFNLLTWGRIGAVAIMDPPLTRADLQDRCARVLADVVTCAESNARAYAARYREPCAPYAEDTLREAIVSALRSWPAGGPNRDWPSAGGGVRYNCDEDPDASAASDAGLRLDDAIRRLPDAPARYAGRRVSDPECPQVGRGGQHSDGCDADTPCGFCGHTSDPFAGMELDADTFAPRHGVQAPPPARRTP